MKKLLFIVLVYTTAVFALANSQMATLTMEGDFHGYRHFTFFIDADNNPNTGYSKGKTKGADF